jgi:hypothetical protein
MNLQHPAGRTVGMASITVISVMERHSEIAHHRRAASAVRAANAAVFRT